MSDSRTARMLRLYTQDAAPTLFLSSMFQSPRENFHDTEEVEIDIVRSDEDVSVVIQDLSTGYRMNETSVFTNKAFKPPVHQEASPINAFDLLKRQAGANPFGNVNFLANLSNLAFRSFRLNEARIRRSMEWQASQVLQTGEVILKDFDGEVPYSINYSPKATHFPTVAVDWDQAAAVPITDLENLAVIIRNDGLTGPNELVFGRLAWINFVANDQVKAYFDNRRINLGTIAPIKRGESGTHQGTITIGSYVYDMWTYDGKYNDPETGVKTPFVDDNKVIMRDADGRMDATFGAIPNINTLVSAPSLLPGFPGRMSNLTGGMDMFTNVWKSVDGGQLFAGVGARPLMIPTAIDTYGCLDTEA